MEQTTQISVQRIASSGQAHSASLAHSFCSRRFARSAFVSLCVVLLLAVLPIAASAQTVTGSVVGTVTDQSGAALPNATVVAKNLDTGVATRTTTNEVGAFSILFLPIGTYNVTITANGFATMAYPEFRLDLDKTVTVNAQLKVGPAATTAVVSGAEYAQLLNTSDASLGNVLDNQHIESIPLNGQNFATATMFEPGAVNTAASGGSANGNAISRVTSNNDQSSVNGNRTQDNNYMVDGIVINQLYNNLVGYNPAPDSIDQMKVISSNATSDYGNSNGGDVMIELKSGTNHIHGTAYWFLENQKLQANSWGAGLLNPVPPITRFTQSQFGGSVGGPILHNKLFYFGDYEGVRKHTAGTITENLYTAAMRTGDFSALLTSSSHIQLYDTQNNFAPYTNDQIPIISPVAKFLFSHPNLYPLPNATPTNGLTQSDWEGWTNTYSNLNQEDIKIEWDPRNADKISGFYSDSQPVGGSDQFMGVVFPGVGRYPTHLIGLSWAHTFSISLVNNAHAGFSRINWITGIPGDPSGLFGLTGDQLLGIPLPYPQKYAGYSAQNGGGALGGGTAANLQDLLDNEYYYDDTLKWQHGVHLFSFGIQALRYEENLYTAENYGFLGGMTYSGEFTADPAVTSGGQGWGPADLVLDRVTTADLAENGGLNGTRQWRSSIYFEDDWRITPTLTLNLGMRYEYDQPWYEAHNKAANLVLSGPNKGLAEYSVTVPAGAPAGSIVCPTRSCYNPSYDQIMPRLGLAWQVTPRFVAHAGYGATSLSEGNLALVGVAPYQLAYYKTSLVPTPTSPSAPYTVESGFTSTAGSDFFSQNTNLAPLNPNAPPQYVQQWNLTLEYSLTPNTSISDGYVGETGSHLRMYMNANQLTAPGATAPFAALVGQGGKLEETLMEGMMDYHAMQATIHHRFGNGFSATLNYTWSRAMTTSAGFYGTPNVGGQNGAAQNGYNIKADYGPAGQDIRQSINTLGLYQLPFGRNRHFLANINRPTDALIGGWQLSGSAILYSGFPLSILSPDNSQQNSYGAARANHYRSLIIKNRSTKDWFGTDPSAVPCTGAGIDNGTCAYGSEGVGQFGTAKVNTERAPGFRQVDASMYKSFTTFRGQKLTFRADAFNLFNIADYAKPANSVTSTTFGEITSVNSVPRTGQLSLKYEF